MKTTKIMYVALIIVVLTMLYSSCAKEKTDDTTMVTPSITDQQLYNMSLGSGFKFYQNNPDTLAFTPGGGGHSGFVRVRFNVTAQAALGTDGKLPVGSVFPEGSLVVKEIYNQKGGLLYRIAIMYKTSKDVNQGANWVWGEYNTDGSNVVGVGNKGAACISCHSITAASSPVPGDGGNRDLVRFFGLH